MRPRHLAPLLLCTLLAGCATKRDLRDLQTEVTSLRTSQEAMLREIQRQNAMLLDSVGAQTRRLRGDLGNQLVQIERQLVQIQELTGQGQRRLTEIREQMRGREEALSAGGLSESAPSAASPEELYNTSLAAFRRGSYSTARTGFEEFLRAYPQHALAAEAQFHVGESYAESRDLPRALEAYGRVLERYPQSPRAPTALFRGGTIELGRGNRDAARTMFNQLVTAYPRSPEAPQAREQLQRMGRR
ncbi:tol-pal system protein YbgF [soil metagenome]